MLQMTGPDAVRDVACLITGRVVQAQRTWLADCCSCQVCQLLCERDEARAELAAVRNTMLGEMQECQRLQALLRECQPAVRFAAHEVPKYRDVRDRLAAALEGRDG